MSVVFSLPKFSVILILCLLTACNFGIWILFQMGIQYCVADLVTHFICREEQKSIFNEKWKVKSHKFLQLTRDFRFQYTLFYLFQEVDKIEPVRALQLTTSTFFCFKFNCDVHKNQVWKLEWVQTWIATITLNMAISSEQTIRTWHSLSYVSIRGISNSCKVPRFLLHYWALV